MDALESQTRWIEQVCDVAVSDASVLLIGSLDLVQT